jgi:tRNA modification GTPase
MTTDTIFAPATASGRAGVAVIRVSGPGSAQALRDLAGLVNPAPRRAVRCRLVDPVAGDVLDDGLALWFPGPASFTGEDVVEFHIHGGRATVQAVCAVLATRKGYRIAEPGEFTRRAFDNGKLDLTRVEGLSDLIAAETEAQRKQALRQLDGVFGAHCEGWREQLLRTLALIEADIDFPEEGLPDDLAASITHNISELCESITLYLDDNRRGERIRDGLFIAIVGPPNVGKSSLLNVLARRDAVIVSDTPGTTRDVVEVYLDLAGYAVTVADTAGLHEATDTVEQEGIRRAHERANAADLRLVVFDAGLRDPDPQSVALLQTGDIAIFNKIDTVPGTIIPDSVKRSTAIPLSVKTGENMDSLMEVLASRVAGLVEAEGPVPLTRERHRLALDACRDALRRAQTASLPELVAEDVRLAARALGRITGRVDVEEVLDVLFREFCIGK